MFIVVPHRGPARWGRECVMGTWDCDADCPGCRDMRDSHAIIGSQDCVATQLEREVDDYTGPRAGHVRTLMRDYLDTH